MYRLECRGSVHAGVALLTHHLEYTRQRLRRDGPGLRYASDDAPLLFALAYGAHLGVFVFEQFRLNPESMVWIVEQCIANFESDDALQLSFTASSTGPLP